MSKYITPIEYDGSRWYLAIGRKAPWDRTIQVHVPKWIAVKFI